jgi:vacuolar protein sorting-associated protein 13A/C
VTYIDQIVLSPLYINLTFQKKASAADADAFVLFKMFLNALGVAFSNIDDAPIKLNGIKLENCFDSTAGITSKLITHYKTQGTREVFKILGSVDILGNPVGLFTNIGTGVVDLFEKPMEGFVKGPLEGGVGIMKGAGSLIKNTFAGTFNSINKITGSVATGLSALSLVSLKMNRIRLG